MVLKEEITDQISTQRGLLHRFAAVDLAPNEQLETGFCALDRERHLIRMDKLYKDDDIVGAVESLGPPNNTLVVIDMPKSLSIQGRWRQEEIKMHPLRLKRPSGEVVSRFESRGIRLYEAMQDLGAQVFLYFNYWTRVNYDMLVPFRSRSPQGCRALQSAIEHQLAIKDMPTNLAPSSVLDAMVGAYASWSVWAGEPGDDYEVYKDQSDHRILIPKGRPHLTRPQRRIHRSRRNLRWSRFSPSGGFEKP